MPFKATYSQRKFSVPFHASSIMTLGLLLAFLLPRAVAQTNPITVGQARFTVVTANCIRLEYSANGHFVDARSLFAVNRAARFRGFRVTSSQTATIIDTEQIRLTYTPDGKPFSPSNLTAVIHKGSGTAVWTPGAANPGNLGGTIRTLDGVAGPVDLGEGLLSRDGWYLLDDSRSPILTADWVQSRPTDAGTDWYLFGYGDDYKSALRALGVIGGPVPLPRKYALGAWYSRYWPYSSADYHQIVAEYGQHDFPLDNIVLDMDWHKDGWTGWSWNRKLLPDAEQLLPWFHSQGLHDTLNLHPADGVGPQEDRYVQFMHDMGADPALGQTLPFDAGSKKYMDALFADIIDPLKRQGVDFWWLDWQQYPYTRSVPDLTNLFWLNTLLYQDTGQDGMRGMSFSRWAGWGDHRHPIHFSGDADTGFPMLAFEVPFTATAGNVGCFFWSHDIGGHQHGRNEESYARWVQFGATSAVLRSHSTRDPTMDRRPWLYPEWATDSMRIAFHLRDELFPYIYSSARQTTAQMLPLDRPMYVEYPKTEAAYHQAQQYFFGDDLLAAPIVTAGVGPGHVSHQTVWFPPGAWYNDFTGEEYKSAGQTQALVSADINEFPLYVRGGVPIPMQPYTPRMATAALKTLVVRCYPGADGRAGTFTLYEDDGQTTAYKQGAFATTPLSYIRRGNAVTITVGAVAGNYRGQATRRSVIVELPDTAQATSATFGAGRLPVTYDAVTMTNRITVPARAIREPVILTVQAAPCDTLALHLRATKRRMAGITGQRVNGADTKTLLTTALNQTTDAAQRNELLAAVGVGLVSHNMAPYLYAGGVHDEFFSAPGLIDNGHITLLSGETVLVKGNAPIDASGAAIQRGGVSTTEPGQVTFSIAGTSITQPLVMTTRNVLSPDNVAPTAKITVSGTEQGYGFAGAVDGIVGGYPSDKSQEWSSGGTPGVWLQLNWDTPQTVDRVALYDRPNAIDQITSGTLTFSDGSSLTVGPLPNDAQTAQTLTFPAKTITWVRFTVTGVKPGTESAGLAEIAVLRPAHGAQ